MRRWLKAAALMGCGVVLAGCGGKHMTAAAPVEVATRTPELEAWEAAGRAYNAGNYEAAVTGYQQFLQQYPNSPHNQLAHYFIAESLSRLGRTSEALEAYSEVIQRNPETIWAQLAQDKQRELRP